MVCHLVVDDDGGCGARVVRCLDSLQFFLEVGIRGDAGVLEGTEAVVGKEMEVAVGDELREGTLAGIGYAVLGLGFKLDEEGEMSLDIAYQRMLPQRDSFTVYSDYDTFRAPVFQGDHTTDKLILSFVLRF